MNKKEFNRIEQLSYLTIVGVIVFFYISITALKDINSSNNSMNVSYSCVGSLCDIPNTEFSCNQSILTSGYAYCDIDDVVK